MRRLLLLALAVALGATGLTQSSLAAFTSTTSSASSGVTAAIDWTPPVVALRDPGAVLRGTAQLVADASDADTSVGRVTIERRRLGAEVWIHICTASVSGSAYACGFDTTAVADGRYELRAVATDTEDNVATSAIRTVTVDNQPPTVALEPLPPAIRGTVQIGVSATDAGTGVASVRLQRSPADTGVWTDVCVTSVAPYVCSLDTSRLANDELDLRAIATDGAGNSATSAVETVMVDNAVPTVSASAPSGTLSGTVTISATAADTHSGVATVTIQRRFGTAAWVTICVDATAPYSCRFDTTQVEAGTYEFRAIAQDVAGNTATSSTITRGVANTAPSVSVEDPGALLSGTVTVEASAYSPIAIASVRIQRAPGGTTSWTDLCVDTAAPYACGWDTTGVPDGPYDLRAILSDVNGVTTVSAVLAARYVDNTPLRGLDVQATNGGEIGRIDVGDVLTLTYSDRLDLTSVIAGWDGSDRAVTVRVRDGGLVDGGALDDTLDVFVGTQNLQTPARIGSVNLRADYIKPNRTATILGSLSATTQVVDGTEVTVISLVIQETPHNNVARRAGGAATMVWTPSSAVRSWSGVSGSAAPVTESGPFDRDF